jgi:surface protein
MFDGASSLGVLDLKNFDTASVVRMTRMFANTTSLSIIDASNWVLNAGNSGAGMWSNTHASLYVLCDQADIYGEICN